MRIFLGYHELDTAKKIKENFAHYNGYSHTYKITIGEFNYKTKTRFAVFLDSKKKIKPSADYRVYMEDASTPPRTFCKTISARSKAKAESIAKKMWKKRFRPIIIKSQII